VRSAPNPLPRIGIGVDVHPFGDDDRTLCLAGLTWPGERGLAGHSDGDVAAHAACDALFSAAGVGDLGTHFGTDRPELAGAAGVTLLAEAVRLGRSARAAGRDAGARVEPSEDGAVATLRAEAARLGFRPTVRDGTGGRHEIVLRECPFAELARRDPGTVCELHVGLAEGIADRSGAIEVEGIRLADPFRGGCRIVVRDADDRPPAT